MEKTRSIGIGASLTVGLLTLAACGAQDADDSPESPVTVTVTAEPDSGSDKSAESDASSGSPESSPTNEPTDDESSADEPLSGPSASPTDGPVLGEDRAGEPLTLADFFRPGTNWEESRYDVADETDVSGFSSVVENCEIQDYGSNAVLEMRLANNFENLKFSVGQSNSSESSDSTMVVRVVGNGEQIEIQRVPFDETQEFDLDVTDVNALRIEMYLEETDEDSCHMEGPVDAVLWDVELQ